VSFFTARSVSVRLFVYLSIFLSERTDHYYYYFLSSPFSSEFPSLSSFDHVYQAMHARVVFSDYCSGLLIFFLSFSFIFFSACVSAYMLAFFPLSHPWLMFLVYRAKTKRHCCNRVKQVFVSSSVSLFLS
jgi:hypothetical protein